MTRITLFLSLALWLVGFGCAHAPKPKELLDLQALRDGRDYLPAQEKQPELVKQSDESYWQSVESWKDEDLEMCKHWAMLSTIRLRTAIAIIKQETARQRLEVARRQVAEVRAQEQDLRAKISDANEQLRLHAQLDASRKTARAHEEQLKAKLSEAEQREQEQKRLAEAQSKVAEAQLALKMADTVEASRYASAEYNLAQSMLQRAEGALKEGHASDAVANADIARTKAEAALNSSRPQYMAARKAVERQGRNQALQKDAAAISGVTVRMKAIGDTQHLILPVPELFRRSETSPRTDKIAVLNQIGALLKSFPDYPVIINGYTSSRVRATQQYAVSQTRAQEVANYLVSLGVEFKRMAVAGHAAETPIAAKASPLNDRVEIVILFQ